MVGQDKEWSDSCQARGQACLYFAGAEKWANTELAPIGWWPTRNPRHCDRWANRRSISKPRRVGPRIRGPEKQMNAMEEWVEGEDGELAMTR